MLSGSENHAAAVDACIGRAILVVADPSNTLVAIEAALGPLHRTVVFATSQETALARLLEQDFALIVLDLELLGMGGVETARMIRSRERSRESGVIFVTRLSVDDKAVMDGYELGRVDFVTKPIHPGALRAKAQLFLEHELETQRSRLENVALQQQVQELVAADRRKDEFLAILAHELRNPLQPIRTAIDLIRHRPDVPVSKPTLAILERRLQHMTRLVDDLLDVSRLATGKLSLRHERVRLASVVDEALSACQPTLTARDHVVVVAATPGATTATVDGDPVRLVQIVSNLLDNAAKYTERGGRIDVEWGCEGPNGFVHITDNGRGIDAWLLPKIFDMFVQERVASDGAGGLGLGLPLVKHLVELHRGTIRAHSAGLGTGSTFRFQIPLALSVTTALRADAVGSESEPATRSLRIVLCDDTLDTRDLFATMLRGHGHEVTVVDDGATAVHTILDERPDVGMIDIGLPDIDGYEVARRIRDQPSDRRTRLIAVTGYAQPHDRTTALAAGFDDHVVKPVSERDLLHAIRGELTL